MGSGDEKRHCPVCDSPVELGEFCRRCRTHNTRSKGIGRSAWMMVGGAAVFLIALALWVDQLHKSKGPDRSRELAEGELDPDGAKTPGQPEPVVFGNESCVPWHVSEASQPPAKSSKYLILTSRLADPAGLVLSGFGHECGERHKALVLENLGPDQLQEAVAQEKPVALIAVGMAAYRRIRQAAIELPILYANILNPIAAGLDKPGSIGVTPWVPIPALLRHLLLVLPEKKSIALIHPAGRLAGLAKTAAQQIRLKKRTVTLFEIDQTPELSKLLTQLAKKTEAWIVLPDRKIINQDTFNRILAIAEDNKIPVGVSDEEHVRRGALVGAGSDSHRIGRQVCRLAGALERGELPEGSHVFCPEYSFAVIHITVAEKLAYLFDPLKVKQVKTYKWH